MSKELKVIRNRCFGIKWKVRGICVTLHLSLLFCSMFTTIGIFSQNTRVLNSSKTADSLLNESMLHRKYLIDSLNKKDSLLNDSLVYQKHLIDSLQLSLEEIRKLGASSQQRVDSLKAENDRLRLIQEYYTVSVNNLMLADVATIKAKSGYYFRQIKNENGIVDRHNEIEWIYISKSNEVRLFISANYEFCMSDMHFATNAQEIYKQINRRKRKFNKLYLKCNGDEKFISCKVLNEGAIELNPKGPFIKDVLLFTVDGSIQRKIADRKVNQVFVYIGE
jgi:hypothetical protein